jgi:hypothetical protein
MEAVNNPATSIGTAAQYYQLNSLGASSQHLARLQHPFQTYKNIAHELLHRSIPLILVSKLKH